MTIPTEKLRQRLLDQRTALYRRVAHVEDDLRWLDTNVEPEIEEEGQEENIARLLSRLDDRGIAEIDEINAALARIAIGDYGRCVGCGADIPLARLEAMPSATSCVACAAARERPGA